MSVRVRFAGSPTGDPHIGNMRTAIYNWLFARHHGGKFIIRVEDTDLTRSSAESVQAILRELRWLGLDWDEGPEVEGPYGPYYQSERLELYEKYVQELLSAGSAYRCYCTAEELDQRRREMSARGLPPKYDRRCANLTAEEERRLQEEGRPCAIRFRIPEGRTEFFDLIRGDLEFGNEQLDDWVMLKSDGYPTYNFGVVIDDHLMEITHVIRGEEHISNTPKQILIYKALGWDMPEFAHLPIILGKDRTKLSKRHGAPSISQYRDMGYLPEALLNFLSLLGWSPGGDVEIMSRSEIVERFDLAGVTKHGAVFDPDKLAWMNGQYIRTLSPKELAHSVKPFLQKAGVLGEHLSEGEEACLERVARLVQERLPALVNAPQTMACYLTDDFPYVPKAVEKWFGKPHTPKVLADMGEVLAGVEPFEPAQIERAVREYAEKQGVGTGSVFHPVRVAVTGNTVGPGLFEALEAIGKDRVLARLKKALGMCGSGENTGGR